MDTTLIFTVGEIFKILVFTILAVILLIICAHAKGRIDQSREDLDQMRRSEATARRILDETSDYLKQVEEVQGDESKKGVSDGPDHQPCSD